MKKQSGFTITELLVTVIVLGVVSAIIAPAFGSLMTAKENAYRSKQEHYNRLLGEGLLEYAQKYEQLGKLPAPYSQNGYNNALYNPVNPDNQEKILRDILRQKLGGEEANHDGTVAKNLRVYQVVRGIKVAMPLYFQSGPQVNITYDYGAIYLTNCLFANAECNKNLPGDSEELTMGNVGIWKTTGGDGKAYLISSLPHQKKMLEHTTKRLDTVMDALRNYQKSKQSTIGGANNWFPNQLGVGMPGSANGKSVGTNQGCKDGWYKLSDKAVLVLSAVGLSQEEYGRTAWGGSIEYCRDYDPEELNDSNDPPHYAAIRILLDVSLGEEPNPIATGENIVLTF